MYHRVYGAGSLFELVERKTISEPGSIYMASMNERISKHFQTMTEHRLPQMKALVKTIPSRQLF